MRGLYSETIGQRLAATDGYIGRVKDALIDDRFWGTNYFVIDTGRWLPGRQVLLSIESVMPFDLNTGWVAVKHTMEEVKNAPPLEEEAPVSAQYERELMAHYHWSVPPFLYARTPLVTTDGVVKDPQTVWNLVSHFESENHLRSANELLGYDIDASGERVGLLEDIVFDMDNWRVSLFVADICETDAVSVSRLIPFSPAWIRSVSWHDKLISIDLSVDALVSSPTFSRDSLNAHYMDKQLFEHYREYLDNRM